MIRLAHLPPGLHVQVGVFGVAFDKPLAGGYFVAHEHVEGFVGFDGFFDVDFEDGAAGWVHG
nr:hypothetical protein [Ktedonobacteraceae bacterium]